MCGIAGAVGVRPGDDRIDRAVAAIRHRGPDAEAVWREADVCLIHTRLSIIDLSPAGAQPMRDQATGVTLVYNGEIYNHRALREAHLTDVPFVGASDSEVLLKLYLRFGLDAVEMLQGMFAFAIWDRASRRLHLARDHLGVKPLYYAKLAHGFLFASELKTLTLCADVSRELNPVAVAEHAGFIWSPGNANGAMVRSLQRNAVTLPAPSRPIMVVSARRSAAPSIRR